MPVLPVRDCLVRGPSVAKEAIMSWEMWCRIWEAVEEDVGLAIVKCVAAYYIYIYIYVYTGRMSAGTLP